jgi:glycosyltransferase involved in cell wall biosynthesis
VAAKLSVLRQVVRRLNGLRSLPKLGFSALRGAITTGLKLPRTVVYLLEIVRIARPVALYIRSSEVDVVHTILPNSYLVGACAAALAGGRPLLMSRLSLNLYQQEHKLVGFIERRILHRTVDAVIGNSDAMLRDLRSEGVNRSKLHLVYNGIDVRGFANEMVDHATARRLLGISNGAIVFTVVANLHPYKGHRDLLHALAALSRTWGSDWLCLFVGKDVHDCLPELKRLCLEYGLSRNVEFLGPRTDVPAILSAYDIHISASHQEGLPNNIIEAMCASARCGNGRGRRPRTGGPWPDRLPAATARCGSNDRRSSRARMRTGPAKGIRRSRLCQGDLALQHRYQRGRVRIDLCRFGQHI